MAELFNQTQSIDNAVSHTNVLLAELSKKLDKLETNMEAKQESLKDTFAQQMNDFKSEVSNDMAKFRRRVENQLKLISNNSHRESSQVVLISNNSLDIEEDSLSDTCQCIVDEILGVNNKIKGFKTSRLKDKTSVVTLNIETNKISDKSGVVEVNGHHTVSNGISPEGAHNEHNTRNGNSLDGAQNKNASKPPRPTTYPRKSSNGFTILPTRELTIAKSPNDGHIKAKTLPRSNNVDETDFGPSYSTQGPTRISQLHSQAMDELKTRSLSRARGRKVTTRGQTRATSLQGTFAPDKDVRLFDIDIDSKQPPVVGERLMCVWQAVQALDQIWDGTCKLSTVKEITERIGKLPIVIYHQSTFKEKFNEYEGDTKNVRFENYRTYALDHLRTTEMPMNLWIEEIESLCWEMCREVNKYESETMSEESIGKLWRVFNRLCQSGSYPPRMASDEVVWFLRNAARNVNNAPHLDNSPVPEEGFTFAEVISYMDRTFFLDQSPASCKKCITDLHDWLVKEVMIVGYLFKRTRKQMNWTNWLKRWFVVYPGKLEYYDNERCKALKGKVMIDASTTVESLTDYTSLTRKLSSRFKIRSNTNFDIELCGENDFVKQQWLNILRECIEGAKSGLTPITRLLQRRSRKQFRESSQTFKETEDRLQKMHNLARKFHMTSPVHSRDSSPNVMKRKLTLADALKNKINSSDPQGLDMEEAYDDGDLQIQKEKIQAVFFSIDTNGNGVIDKDEFAGFMEKLGLKMDRREMDLIFETIDKDGSKNITFDECYDYFVKFVLDGTENTTAEAQMRKAFIEADRNGSGTICFQEFMDYASSRRSDLALSKLTSAFEQLDKEKRGEVSFQEFRTFFANTTRASIKGLLHRQNSRAGKPTEVVLENSLKCFYDDADATSVATYLRDRWNAFASFRRYGSEGDLVMHGKHGIVGDLVPGQYSLLDIACFNDLPPIEPKKRVVPGVKWLSSSVPGKSGKVVFPEDFDGSIPIDIASNEHLAYYDCSLATGNQLKVSLLYRHGVQDFTYQNNYFDEYVTNANAMGGAGIEKHDFAHLDCPFEDDSGYFVIGKMDDDVLYLTAFKVPTRHAVYLPPNIIHSNDYLKGTWRTMLSDEADIDHVQLVTPDRGTDEFRHFAFKFNKNGLQ